MKKVLVSGLIAAQLWVFSVFPAASQDSPQSRVRQEMFASGTLGENILYSVYLPAGYNESTTKYPVLYVLHGRDDTMSALEELRDTLDALIVAGDIPPLIVVMPDAPWSDGGSYYVDSRYTGYPPGRPVETTFFSDFIPHIDAAYRTLADRESRIIGGYSMGGYGTIRYALAHPDTFSGAIVLSPAVYIPLPPQDSSTREFGAFGKGDVLFDEAVYQRLNYPALLPAFEKSGLPLSMFIAAGDDEWKNPNPADYLHDIDMEAHLLYNRVSRVSNITAELRIYDGGHDWNVWQRGFIEGLRFIAPNLRTAS